jgi:hypothetical protein
MRLSSREKIIIAEEKPQEHTELIGGPQVMIEPYNSMVNDAVAIVNRTNPELLKQISDIRINLSKGVIGEYQSDSPNTIWINMGKLEGDVRAQLSGQPEETIKQEMINQIASTIIHEGTHKGEFDQTGFSSESKPEQAEEAFRQQISPRQ